MNLLLSLAFLEILRFFPFHFKNNPQYNGAKIQLLDLPGIVEGAHEGKGRGRQVHAHYLP